MGCSDNPHPLIGSQIWASDSIPTETAKEGSGKQAFCPLAREAFHFTPALPGFGKQLPAKTKRVVDTQNRKIGLCVLPYGQTWPYEVHCLRSTTPRAAFTDWGRSEETKKGTSYWRIILKRVF